ncbi:hypothetical protein G7Y89_g3530 [Cudoniella acicularis]|uniref:Uncharacterized protein n=1 Tax=Cudoniella acicularis TaxID=354080 RepID=A0A8H4RS07_9HELO|nr:hypothetical protein G7Y89_g3530 [Cudoniella acicularis]
MRFNLSALIPLLSLGLAGPVNPRGNPNYPDPRFLPLTFTFYGGPASYTLNFEADAYSYATNNDLSVSSIDTGGFDAFNNGENFCFFYDVNNNPITSGLVSSNGGTSITVGPPQVITAVACEVTPASNTCIAEYGM